MWISCLLDTEHTDGQTAHLEHWTVQDGETSHRAAGDVNSTYQHRAGRASNGEEVPAHLPADRPFTSARHTQEEN